MPTQVSNHHREMGPAEVDGSHATGVIGELNHDEGKLRRICLDTKVSRGYVFLQT